MTINTIIQGAIISALAFISTAFLRIPISFGYIHLGDLILVIALSLDKRIIKTSLFGASISIGLADLYLGFPQYILITIFTRVAIVFLCVFFEKKKLIWPFIFLFIPINYFLFDFSVFSIESAIFFIPFNLIQIIPIHILIFGKFGFSRISFKKEALKRKSQMEQKNPIKILDE